MIPANRAVPAIMRLAVAEKLNCLAYSLLILFVLESEENGVIDLNRHGSEMIFQWCDHLRLIHNEANSQRISKAFGQLRSKDLMGYRGPCKYDPRHYRWLTEKSVKFIEKNIYFEVRPPYDYGPCPTNSDDNWDGY